MRKLAILALLFLTACSDGNFAGDNAVRKPNQDKVTDRENTKGDRQDRSKSRRNTISEADEQRADRLRDDEDEDERGEAFSFVTDDGDEFDTRCEYFEDGFGLAGGQEIPGGPPLEFELQELLSEGELTNDDEYKFSFHALRYIYYSLNESQRRERIEAIENNTAIPREQRDAIIARLEASFDTREGAYDSQAQRHAVKEWTLTRPEHLHQGEFVKEWFHATIENATSEDCSLSAEKVARTSGDIVRERKQELRGGCFAPETLITLADGSSKAIDQLTSNDRVFNPLLQKSFEIAEIVVGPETRFGMIEVGVGKKMVVVTRTHPFPTTRGLQQAQHLTLKDKILNGKGSYEAITHYKVRKSSKHQMVYNLTLKTADQSSRSHMVLADGIVAGDLFLQNQLENRRNPQSKAKVHETAGMPSRDQLVRYPFVAQLFQASFSAERPGIDLWSKASERISVDELACLLR